jgi:hypothetical protein
MTEILTEYKVFIELTTSILTPVVILLLGIKINNTIEKHKALISKEKTFDEYWAMKLINVADEYNLSVESFISNINRLHEIQKKQFDGWKDEEKILVNELSIVMRDIQN